MTLNNSLTTDKPVALGFKIELEFRNVGFCGGRKTGVPGDLGARMRTNNKLHPHMAPGQNQLSTRQETSEQG